MADALAVEAGREERLDDRLGLGAAQAAGEFLGFKRNDTGRLTSSLVPADDLAANPITRLPRGQILA